MSRRLQEKRAKKAQNLQRDVDRFIQERLHLLESSAKAGDFRTKSDIWKVVHQLENNIERLSRTIRCLQTPPKEEKPEAMLWDFASVGEERPKKPTSKGGRKT